MKQQQPNRARKNWSKLRSIIKSGNLCNRQKEKKFHLFQKTIHHTQKQMITQYKYQNMIYLQKSSRPVYKQLLHYQSNIDATGKWIWQAQQIAAYFFIKQANVIVQQYLNIKTQQQQKKLKPYLQKIQILDQSNINKNNFNKLQQLNILQLGSGCSGLASICLSHTISTDFPDLNINLSVTDGQQENIYYLQQNIQLNLSNIQSLKAKGSHLLWGKNHLLQTKQQKVQYDIIIICDCLYFVNFQLDLMHTILKYLSQNGTVYLINPARGDSMFQFMKLIEQHQFYHEEIIFKDQKYEGQLHNLMKQKDFNQDKFLQKFTKIKKSNK